MKIQWTVIKIKRFFLLLTYIEKTSYFEIARPDHAIDSKNVDEQFKKKKIRLFDCFGFFHSNGDFTVTGKGLEIVYLCSALMPIEGKGFFRVLHLLWHGSSVCMVIHKSLTLTPVAEGLSVELSLPVLKTSVCRNWRVETSGLPVARLMLDTCTCSAGYID